MRSWRGDIAAKIICTLGPASSSEQVIERLVKHGMSVVRLNFSHGNHDSHLELITKVREISARVGRPICIMQDLCGPKVRVGRLRNGQALLQSGALLTLSGDDCVGDAERITINTPQIIPDLKPGNRIYLADGRLQLKVVEAGERRVKAKVIRGGSLGERQGVNLPDADLSMPSLTAKDKADVAFGIRHHVDLIALSFVRSSRDVVELKAIIERAGQDTPVFAKLEKPEAVRNLAAIVDVADGLIVARGDLGVELPLERVPVIQKEIGLAARRSYKPVIVATQMLESMTNSLRPTRAEASDVANAVFEGSDGLMLSGETAAGKHPVEAVKTMAAIIHAAEHSDSNLILRDRTSFNFSNDFSAAVAEAAVTLALDVKARLIACFTRSGLTARLISKQCLNMPVIAFTSNRKTLTRLPVFRGVTPTLMPNIRSVDQIIVRVEERLKEMKLADCGDRIVIVASAPVAAYGQTNMLKLHEVG